MQRYFTGSGSELKSEKSANSGVTTAELGNSSALFWDGSEFLRFCWGQGSSAAGDRAVQLLEAEPDCSGRSCTRSLQWVQGGRAAPAQLLTCRVCRQESPEPWDIGSEPCLLLLPRDSSAPPAVPAAGPRHSGSVLEKRNSDAVGQELAEAQTGCLNGCLTGFWSLLANITLNCSD